MSKEVSTTTPDIRSPTPCTSIKMGRFEIRRISETEIEIANYHHGRTCIEPKLGNVIRIFDLKEPNHEKR